MSGAISEDLLIISGVHQGFVSGSLLFFIYIVGVEMGHSLRWNYQYVDGTYGSKWYVYIAHVRENPPFKSLV